MRQTKRRIEIFSFFNGDGICRHLEKMAARGWLLEKVGGLVWRYRRVEPMKATFAISYCPKASEFDPEPSEEQKDLFDFCAHTGWNLVCTSAQMQIFYNERPDPTPIETEPELEYEAICAAAKKSFLPPFFVLLGVGVLQAFMLVGSLLNDPISLLASSNRIASAGCWLILLAICSTELLSFFYWKRKARPMVEQGILPNPPDTSGFQRGCLVIVVILTAYWIIDTVLAGDSLRRWVTVFVIGYMILLIGGVNGMKVFLKRKKASRTLNRNLTMATSFVLAFAMVGVIGFGVMYLNRRGFFADKNDETYEYHGNTFVAPHDEIPLTLEELLGSAEQAGDIKERRGGESVLLGKYTMRQYPRFDSETYTSMYRLEYDVVKVKVPFLYDMCRNYYIRHRRVNGPDYQKAYLAVDPAPWGAGEAYRLEDTDVGPRDEYLLCYDDVIVKIRFDWEVTAEQMALVGDRLGGL